MAAASAKAGQPFESAAPGRRWRRRGAPGCRRRPCRAPSPESPHCSSLAQVCLISLPPSPAPGDARPLGGESIEPSRSSATEMPPAAEHSPSLRGPGRRPRSSGRPGRRAGATRSGRTAARPVGREQRRADLAPRRNCLLGTEAAEFGDQLLQPPELGDRGGVAKRPVSTGHARARASPPSPSAR